MIGLKRRMTFQLTPLLDLLLIVIFAQYMEVQQQSDQQAAVHASEMDDAREKFESQLAELETDAKTTEELLVELREREQQLREELERSIREQGAIGSTVSEIFRLPKEMLDDAIERRNESGQPLSAEDEKQLRETFRRLARERGLDVVKHLMTYQELRKRCDVWEIYVADNGLVTFTTGEDTFEFRASSREDFVDQVMQRFRTVEEPKSLVIMIFSYGDARVGVLEPVLNGMPGLTTRMRDAYSGRSRFEYAVLGYSPTGPTLKDDQ